MSSPQDTDLRNGDSVFCASAGCFWGVEQMFIDRYHDNGIATAVGYTGGTLQFPTYRTLGDHSEAVFVRFNSTDLSYDDMALFFFRMHDPTQSNGQGNDKGKQYRSAIYYIDEQQRQSAIRARNLAELFYAKHYGQPVVTKILPFKRFWKAERSHQRYLERNPDGCVAL